MNKQSQRIFWSIVLIVLGFVLLLENFNILGGISDLVWAVLFAGGAVMTAGYYLNHPRQWWILFPTAVFAGIAGVITLDTLNIFHSDLGGAFFLAALALPFWIIFIREKSHWWAAIPGGVMSTLACVVAIEEFSRGDVTAPVLFGGMGLTFGLLWFNRKNSPTDWAKWPAMGLIGFGLFVSVAEYFDQLWPLVLIVVGAWILWRNSIGRKKEDVVFPAESIK